MKLKTTIQDLSIIFTAFFALHFIVLPYLCSNVAHSIYFKKIKQIDEQVEYDFDEDIECRTENNNMAIIVQTSNRDTSYRNRTLMSLDTELLRNEQAGHQVIVCSAEGTDNSLEMPVISHFGVIKVCLTRFMLHHCNIMPLFLVLNTAGEAKGGLLEQ